MYRYTASLVLLVLLVSGAACTKATFRPLDPAAAHSYEPVGEVKVFRNYPDVPYKELGTLRAVGPNKAKLLKSIIKRAKKVGAQAIVVKPPAERTNEYVSQRRSEFSKVEYIMEAVALRFQAPGSK